VTQVVTVAKLRGPLHTFTTHSGPVSLRSKTSTKVEEPWQDNPRFTSQPSPADLKNAAGLPFPFSALTPAWPPFDIDFMNNPDSRVLVLPKAKLAFCYIEKNACTEFNGLFNHMNGITTGDMWWRSQPMNFGLQVSDLTQANGWKWAVFLRDPASRYLSAWGSKCLQQEDDGINCIPNEAVVHAGWADESKVASFKNAVVWNSVHQESLHMNPHWANQSDFCGGLGDLTSYDMVGILRGDVNGKVRAMLQAVGADYDSVDFFFPPEQVAGHASNLSKDVYFSDEQTETIVNNIYRTDKALFKQFEP